MTDVLMKDVRINGVWNVLKMIGAGSFGQVFTAINMETNELAAIKMEETKKTPKLSSSKNLPHDNTLYCTSHRACWKHFYPTDSLHKHTKAAKFFQIVSVYISILHMYNLTWPCTDLYAYRLIDPCDRLKR